MENGERQNDTINTNGVRDDQQSSTDSRLADIPIYTAEGKFNAFKSIMYKVQGLFNKFPDFLFVQAFKIVVDTWKFSILLQYILWDDIPIFMISGSNEQLQQQLEYTLLKPDCHIWWISKMQSWLENT